MSKSQARDQKALERAAAREGAAAVVFVGAVLAVMLWPVLAREGWPLNHEGLSWKYRLLVYVQHFRRLDLLPVWSESAALGLGAPAPVLYHKLFYFVAAGAFLLTGSVKAAVVAALAIFSASGLFGMRALLERLGAPRAPALVAGAALLFCSYSYTDWVVRGAFAEYSALMLLPWLLRWLAGVLDGEAPRSSFRVGALVLPLLYLAHSGLFFFAALPAAGAVVWRLARGADREAFVGALLGIALVLLAVVGPIVGCQLVLARELSFAEGIAVYLPRDHYASLARHLTGGGYDWGETWEGLSVQLDLPLVALALLLLVWVLWAELRRRPVLRGGARAAYAGFWAAAVYYAFLLTPASEPVYDRIPGFAAVQFPWRLLSFLSVLGVTLTAAPLLSAASGRRHAAAVCAALLLVIGVLGSPWLHRMRYGWVPRAELEAPLEPLARLQVGGFEYHPRTAGVPGPLLTQYWEQQRPPTDARAWNEPGYDVELLGAPGFEAGERLYRVRASRPGTVVLPITYSAFIRVELVSTSERLATGKTDSDPRLHFGVPEGESMVRVRFPTLRSVCEDLWPD